jgi:glycosyltransferase involved in cell wall biosynthesis
LDTIVTVIMPVYNCEKYLYEAVNSILNQTLNTFEFIIIDDNSSDMSWEILQSFHDDRITLIKNESNLGPYMARNIGLEKAKGRYIALMDADDISLANRLERQVACMEANPEVGICGTWARAIDGEHQIMKRSLNHDYIRIGLLFKFCLINPTVMLRSLFFKERNLSFNTFLRVAGDYEMWVRSSKYFKMTNIPEVLLLYRIHKQQISFTSSREQVNTSNLVMKAQIKALGIDATEEELELHGGLVNGSYMTIPDFPVRFEKWFLKLINANHEALIYPEKIFTSYLASLFFLSCRKGNFINYLTSLSCKIESKDQHIYVLKSRIKFRLIGIIHSLYLAFKRNERLF